MQMNTPWSVLVKIAGTDSKNEKQAIIRAEAVAGNDEFFRGCIGTFDTMITYGVKQIPEATVDGKGLAPAAFWALAKDLADRKRTGHAALNAINFAKMKATVEEWNGWYRRILMKDLKADFSESTVNKVCDKDFPKYVVPKFECQLAKDCVDDEGNVAEELLCGKKQIDVKLDGMRVLTIATPDGIVNQFSRNGKELLNFGVVKEQIAKHAVYFKETMVLDGEIMSASFQDLMKQAKRKTDVQADDSVLNLFDIIPLREFKTGKGTVKQNVRTVQLLNWFNPVQEFMPNVTVVGTEVVDLDTKAGQDRLSEINAKALAGKYEGIMLKDPEAVYECKRSVNWLKMKPFIEESLTVTDVEAGKVGSKFEGTMGALVCEDTVDGKPVKVNCGGGYSIQLRAKLWARHTGKPVDWKKKVNGAWRTFTETPDGGPVVGLIAEVRADALTKSQDSDTWSMRFPRFKTFRGTTPGEKL
jgi:DNA ligase-1